MRLRSESLKLARRLVDRTGINWDKANQLILTKPGQSDKLVEALTRIKKSVVSAAKMVVAGRRAKVTLRRDQRWVLRFL